MNFGDDQRGGDIIKESSSPLIAEIPSKETAESETNQPVRILSTSPQTSDPLHQEGRPRLGIADVHNAVFDPQQGHDGASRWNASSEKQDSSPTAGNDRVFPIRSVVSVDPSQTPYMFEGRNSREQQDYFPSHYNTRGGIWTEAAGPSSRYRQSSQPETESKSTSNTHRPVERRSGKRAGTDRKGSTSTTYSDDRQSRGVQIFNDTTSEKSSVGTGSVVNSTGTYTPADQESIDVLVTARFKHIVTEEGHAVIIGHDGETVQRCEDEPIHIPGAVQSFGLLIALEERDESQLVVRIVSENSYRMIGYHPQDLFKLDSFTDILSEEQIENLLDHIDFIRDEESDPATNGPEVFTLSIKPPSARRSRKLWCAMHTNPSNPDVILCEFELDDDQTYPLVPFHDADTPELPEDTLNSQPTEDELTESTLPHSKPLRVLRSARKKRGEAAAMEVFNIMSQVQEQLASAPNLDTFLKILVGVVKELTGFHRVMIYQFDAAYNGRVVTELVDPRATKDLYKGLNFPASDIPKQARELYKINKVRLLYDRDLETSRLVCRSVEDLESPLDLSFSYLRAMSPIHIKYLANMAVRSSMSISINAFGELWGLIACHTYGSKGMRVSFPIRKMCRLVGDTASRNIERLSYASRLQARKLINTVPTEANPSGYIIASSDDLLKLFDADFGLLSIRGETKIMGKIDQTQEGLAMLEYLRLRKITSVITSQDIKVDFPDLRYPPGFDVIAGLLLVPLSVAGNDFIVFFRKGQVREVKWAGNPYEKFIKEGTEGYLEPRKSFRSWSETVLSKCREWTEEQVETAAVLCLVYGKFIEVWRQKEAAMQNSQLTKLLLSNSAHEVRTPLNAIINYLEIALEGALDQETRDNIAKSHSASKSLVYVINDLLDLTKTEEGYDLMTDDIFALPATIREAADSFRGEAKRKGLEYEVTEHPGFPQYVYGDQRRIRQAVANIVANSVQYTSSGWIHVEMWLQDSADGKATVEIVIQDSGCGISDEKLDELFRELEQVSEDGKGMGLGDSGPLNQRLIQGKGSRTLGLGLATVARIIRNADGQLRLKSEEGKGSRFVIQLSFLMPDDDALSTKSDGRPSLLTQVSAESHTSPLSATPPPKVFDGEVNLIDKTKSVKYDGEGPSHAIEENASLRSFRSGSSTRSNRSNKSDVDRLIDAISGPLAVGESEPEERSIQRSNSRGSGNSRRSAGSLGKASSARASITHDKPGRPVRSKSYGTPEHLRSSIEGPVGSEFVQDNKTPMRAVRMPDDSLGPSPEKTPTRVASKVLFDIPDKPRYPASSHGQQDAEHLQVLVAEDDPVNSKIVKKRLGKSGHVVYLTVNGEECASAYGEKPAFFDVVLMDMQMPIVDGLTSTKMIRSFEKSHAGQNLSPRATFNDRVPIFAVSASLVEREHQTYIEAGFDGWILKPIDFKRLNTLLTGIVDETVRNRCLYKPGEWERGGWFHQRQSSIFQASTKPSRKPLVLSPPVKENLQPDGGSVHSSESGSITPTGSSSRNQLGWDGASQPRRPLIHDERLDASKG